MSYQLISMGRSTAEIEQELDASINNLRQNGFDVSWKKNEEEQSVRYEIDVKGNNLSLLSDVVFEGAHIQSVEGGAVEFSYFPSGDILGASQNIVALHGAEIVNTNGQIVEPGTVRWVNSVGVMQATIIPKARTNVWTMLLLVLLGAGVAAAVYYFWKRSPQVQPQTLQNVSKQSAACKFCQASLSPEGKFCPKCGRAQPGHG